MASRKAEPRRYETPLAFRQALEARLRRHARDAGQPFSRVRRLWTYDRFLARLHQEDGEGLVVKGGMALELRLERARMTGDIDVRWPIEAEAVHERLERAGRQDLGDFLSFAVRPDADHPDINEAARYEGRRYRVTPRLGGKVFVGDFGVDVITGGPMVREPDVVVADDLLDFAGIPPPQVRVVPVETHLAEKLHAYTMPRGTPNSRVRDLPDLALLATIGSLKPEEVRRAFDITFAHRRSHPVPTSFPAPPPGWAVEYRRIAEENALVWKDLEAVTEVVHRFLNPLLAGGETGRWNPERWEWVAE